MPHFHQCHGCVTGEQEQGPSWILTSFQLANSWHIAGLLPQHQWAVAPQTGAVFRNRKPHGTYFCSLAFMLSSFAAVMTFGCRPPVSHGPAANAVRAAGRQPSLSSVCQPPLLVYTEKVIYKIFLPVVVNCNVLFLSGSHFQTLRTLVLSHMMWENTQNLLMYR